MSVRYGSVCSGIESASVAWHPLGWRPAWFAEVDKACSRLLGKRFPHVINHGDMIALPDAVSAGTVEAPDIIVGGTPCQDFSIAGMRAGLAGQRGQLTMTYVQLVDAVDEKRGEGNECIAVWENVPGVLNHKANPFGNFLGALAGEDCALVPPGKRWTDAGVVVGPRRTVAWRCLDAQYFGLAQRRKRVFVVASARDDFDPAAVLFEREGVRRDTPPRREAGQSTTHATAPYLTSSGRGVERTGDPRGQDPVVAAFGAGNCSGPIAAAAALNANERYDFDSETFVVQPPLAFAQNSRDEVRLMGGDGSIVGALAAEPGMKQTCYVAFTQKDHGQDASTDIAPTLRAMQGAHANGGGQVAVAINGRMDPCYYGDKIGALDTDGGTSVVAIQERAVCENPDAGPDGIGVRTDGVAYTLEARSVPQAVATPLVVRRLMPVECERLQGFPDGWTEGQADGPRYKQLGNSKAVPVVRWIGRRIEQELRTGWLRGIVDAFG